MDYQFKCSVCNEILGTITKTEITQDDRDLYQESMICSNGHEQSVQIEEIV